MALRFTVQKPRYYLDALAARHNPVTSWWVDAPRESFTRVVSEREWPRMRLSKYGNCHPSPGKPGMGTVEMYRAKKAMAGRVGQA